MFRLTHNGEAVAANRDRDELLLDHLGTMTIEEGYHVEEYHLDIDAATRDRLLDESRPMGERFGELVSMTIDHVLPGEANGYKLKVARRLGMSDTDLSVLQSGKGVNVRHAIVFKALHGASHIGEGLDTALAWAIVLPDLLRLGEGDRGEVYEAVMDAADGLLAREPKDPGPPNWESRAEGEQCEGENAEAFASAETIAETFDFSGGP